jgi:dUTP pyrophosphatase
MPVVKFKKLREGAKIPQKRSEGAAAYDIYYPDEEPLTLYPSPWRAVNIVPTGLAVEIPPGWKGEIYSRSGLASEGIWVVNQPGKIDCDYRGEIKILVYNSSRDPVTLTRGARIAQLEVNPVHEVQWEEDTELTPSKRGEAGFGSTGWQGKLNL